MGPLAFSVGRVHDVVCTLRDLVQARAACTPAPPPHEYTRYAPRLAKVFPPRRLAPSRGPEEDQGDTPAQPPSESECKWTRK